MTRNPKFVETTWEVRSYDVWGNSRDGYEVNDTYRIGEVTIRCRIEVNNPDTPQVFLSAYPSDSQIREALGLRRFKLELDGDDLSIYVNRARDGYPCGELYCTSHKSLSPIQTEDHSGCKYLGNDAWDCGHLDSGYELSDEKCDCHVCRLADAREGMGEL